MKKIMILFAMILIPVAQSFAQDNQGDIYKGMQDSLQTAVVVSRQAGNYLPKGKDIRTEVISAAGLCKMACCNLAESFENSASVTVGYSDAVTGARQIRLLGLSGVYTQMLDENRPVMRGLIAPFGLSYVPGQWLESIQIAKGAPSVINGVESMTGQINMEHRKPTDEKPLFVNFSMMSDSKTDLNVASSLQLNESWSTVLLAHASTNFMTMDNNGDGFVDDPKQLQLNFANRWLYYSPGGTQLRFGIRALRDKRVGGEVDPDRTGMPGYDHEKFSFTKEEGKSTLWGSDILNNSLNGYVKIGVPLDPENSKNIAAILDYNWQSMDSYFGASSYLGGEHSGFLNLLFQDEVNDTHKFTLGLSSTADKYSEDFHRLLLAPLGAAAEDYDVKKYQTPLLANAGVFGEYTCHIEDKFTTIVGLRGDYYSGNGFKFSPRLTLKYAPIEEIVLRANGGRGLRFSNPLTDNIGVFSTSKRFTGSYMDHTLEDSWVAGGNATFYLPFGASTNTYISLDYFHTEFVEQKIVDYEHHMGIIDFYNLSQLTGGRSFTDTYQLDFSVEPVERFTVNLTGRFTNSMLTLADKGLVERPMTGKYKAVLNLQYATHLNKWIFDFTASLNGPCRVYNFMKTMTSSGEKLYENGYSPVYPLLYLQVTKRFKGIDLYIGGENLTNFRQEKAVFADYVGGRPQTAQPYFDASCVWGPIMGIKVYAGMRLTLWKTEKNK